MMTDLIGGLLDCMMDEADKGLKIVLILPKSAKKVPKSAKITT